MPTSTPATSDGARPAAGFTLIEVTLVILIIGVLLSLAVPRLSLLGQARLDGTARRIATLISYLHDEAALRGRIYRLTLDLDRQRYDITVQRPYAADPDARRFTEQWDPYARSAQLPGGIRIVTVETATAAQLTGTASLYFLPESNLEEVRIVLEEDGGERALLDLDPVTGQVEISALHAQEPGR